MILVIVVRLVHLLLAISVRVLRDQISAMVAMLGLEMILLRGRDGLIIIHPIVVGIGSYQLPHLLIRILVRRGTLVMIDSYGRDSEAQLFSV